MIPDAVIWRTAIMMVQRFDEEAKHRTEAHADQFLPGIGQDRAVAQCARAELHCALEPADRQLIGQRSGCRCKHFIIA